LLSLIQVRKQRVEFMLKFFCCAHAGSIAQRALCVSVIVLRALTVKNLLDGGLKVPESRVVAIVEDATLREPPCLLGVALSTGGIYHGCCAGKTGAGNAIPPSPTDEEFMQLSACRLAGLTALAVLLPGAAPPREGPLEAAFDSIKPAAILQHIKVLASDEYEGRGPGTPGAKAESGTGTILTRWGVLAYGSVMPRTAQVAPGGMVFHVLNRGVARMQLFEKAADYQAFEQVLRDTLDQSPMRICAYAVMPNHWHLLLWPECDGELAAFMQRLTITHVRRWQEHRGYAGLGHVYQGRYKSFPVESDEHFWVVARYVERNALRANLVLRAEEWRWSSLWQRCHPTGEERSLLAAWPIDMPANWLERVNQTDDAQELEALRRSVQRGRPFGQPEWQKEIANVWA